MEHTHRNTTRILRSLFLALLLSATQSTTVSLWGAPVEEAKALLVARNALGGGNPSTRSGNGAMHCIWGGSSAAPRTRSSLSETPDDPAFYVFAREGGGFVIVSGNDCVTPILGISYENDFRVEGMPDNVRWWMAGLDEVCRTATQQDAKVRAAWERLTAPTPQTRAGFTEVQDIHYPRGEKTVEWDQGAPGNSKCPIVFGNRSISGCVPVAMAEILVWHGDASLPRESTATIPLYSYTAEGTVQLDEDTYVPDVEDVTIPAHALTQANWAGIGALQKNTKTFSQYKNTDQADLVSQILYDCGTMVGASFSPGATGAQDWRVIDALREWFNYDANMQRVFYNTGDKENPVPYFDKDQWDALLKNQVADHPVYYSGACDGGHAYVLDGYGTLETTGEIVFHFNFGWGGSNNGFYYSTQPYRYYRNLCAIVNMKPASDAACRGGLYFATATSDARLCILSGSVAAKNVTVGWNQHEVQLRYSGPGTMGPGITAIALVGADGQVRKWVREGHIGGISRGTVYTCGDWHATLDFTDTPTAIGDRLAWAFVPDDDPSHPQVVDAVIPSYGDDPNLTCPAAILASVPLYPAAFIQTRREYHKGDHFFLRLSNTDYTYPNAVWTITSPSGIQSTWRQQDDFSVTESESPVTLDATGVWRIQVDTGTGETLQTSITVKP